MLYPSVGTATECSDRSGDVFVATGSGLMEFQHGAASPITTIGIPSDGCSVDPVTGDLAVTQFREIYIFRYTKVGWHLPAVRTPPFQATACAYDDRRNLFIDGSSGSQLELAELPRSTKAFTSIDVNQSIRKAESVQWDGAHLAVTDIGANPTRIYRFSIGTKKATLIGKTTLSGAEGSYETWIFKQRVVATSYYNQYVGIWKYPQGGSPIRTASVDPAGGVTVSR